MKKILVPFDGSESSLRALRYAMTLADDIQIVNVQPKADAPALLLHMTQDDIDRMQVGHGQSLLAGARKVLDDAKYSYRPHVLIGEPAPTIVQLATSERVDAIVMGTRGMTAVGNLVMGSVATKVVHFARVPVTLVK